MAETLIYATVLLVPLFAFACARGAKGLGQKFSLTRLTDIASVIETIAMQMRAFGRAATIAILLVAAALALLVLVPSTGTSWAPFISTAIGFGANLALGFSAGVGGNVAGILAKPGARDTIDCQVDMKHRLRRLLRRFLKAGPVALLVLLYTSGLLMANDGIWSWAIDVTDSMDPAQRETVIDGLIGTAPERAHQLGVAWIQVVKFDQAGMLSDVSWVRVPAELNLEDCQQATPLPVVMEGLTGLSPALAEGWKQKAIDECMAHQRGERRVQENQEQAFRKELLAATRITPKANVTTRIVPVIEWLVGGARTVALDVVSDGIDHSGIPLGRLRIPKRVRVSMIVTRPNPKRTKPSLDDVLSAAAAWSRVPGITVVGAGGYAELASLSDKGAP